MIKPIVRFAPSPTGQLHIGNARTALLNALFARREGGTFILRFDDTDLERSRREYADGIEVDLKWLGVEPDLIFRQSERFDLYNEAADRLRKMGRLYPCYETPDELERRRKRQLARGLPPVYDRAALNLTDQDHAAFKAEGRNPHWRFKLDATTITFEDNVRGKVAVDCASLSDPVLVRADGSYLYTLPSVADDIEMGITHVIRGEDHITNTAVQIQIIEALGGKPSQFAHHNLLTTASGEGLSKRLGHLSLKSLREAEFEPEAVASLAVLVGSSETVRAISSLAELSSLVDFSHISKGPAKFDEHDLDQLNAKLMHEASFNQVRNRLEALNIQGGEAFWLAVRGNLAKFSEISIWWQVVEGPIAPQVTDHDFMNKAIAVLPQEPLDHGTWKTWTDAIKQETGLKGKNLFMPLRLALTGLEHGPELAGLLPLIGRDKVVERLKGKEV
jgi:glutamyl-tRNA synthetase